MKPAIDEFIAEIDHLIRSAQGEAARQRLREFSAKDLRAQDLWKIAALARRANLPEISIQILRPIVRPVKKISQKPTDQDLAEYAGALIRLGANQEAVELLKKVEPTRFPDALLFRAILKMKEWDYEAATTLIKQYLSQAISNYSSLVGRMNFAACLLYEGSYAEAKQILELIVQETEVDPELLLVRANATRLLGNLELNRNHLQAALGYFMQGEGMLAPVGGLEHFFSRKWCAIAEFLIRPSHQDGLAAIEQEAIEKQHWETIRDLDYHRALVLKDPRIIHKLYVGSPFPAFQERLKNKFPGVTIPDCYELKLGEGTSQVTLDVREPENFKVPLKGGQSVHRLFTTLLSDFYRRFSISALFECVYPGEFYTPKVSEYRVHQAIKRLRQWFTANKLPLTIEAEHNNYRIGTSIPCTVLIQVQKKASNAGDHRLSILQQKLQGDFSVLEVATVLGVSRRSANDLIKKGIESGLLEKRGSGPKTRYRFATAELKEPLFKLVGS